MVRIAPVVGNSTLATHETFDEFVMHEISKVFGSEQQIQAVSVHTKPESILEVLEGYSFNVMLRMCSSPASVSSYSSVYLCY